MTLERLKILVTTPVAVILLLGAITAAWASFNGVVTRLDSQDKRIDRLVTLMEIEAELTVEPRDSPEYLVALSHLHAMRKFIND